MQLWLEKQPPVNSFKLAAAEAAGFFFPLHFYSFFIYSWRHFNCAEQRSRLQQPVILEVDGHIVCVCVCVFPSI